MEYLEVLSRYYGDKKWTILNKFENTYGSLIWNDTTTEKPTEEELNALWQEMKDDFELNIFRVKRNELLKESDLYVIPDFPHKTLENKEAWITYRQALRDSTKDQILPTPPS